jgi:hypothetical protein
MPGYTSTHSQYVYAGDDQICWGDASEFRYSLLSEVFAGTDVMEIVDTCYKSIVWQTIEPFTCSRKNYKAFTELVQDNGNPMHILIKLNTLLLERHRLGGQLIGFTSLILKYRAAAAALAFQYLDQKLRQAVRGQTTDHKKYALWLHTAMLLDQVLATKEDIAKSPLMETSDEYLNMRRQLIQFLSSYLRLFLKKILHHTPTQVFEMIRAGSDDQVIDPAMWRLLAIQTGILVPARSFQASFPWKCLSGCEDCDHDALLCDMAREKLHLGRETPVNRFNESLLDKNPGLASLLQCK